MLRFICYTLALTALLTVSNPWEKHTFTVTDWTTPQVADGTEPGAPPFPLGPRIADGTEPGAPPFPLAA